MSELSEEPADMRFVRIGACIIAVLAIAMGLLWLGQGTGVVLWPSDSFMLQDRTWARNGLLLAAAGAIVLWLALPRQR
ncbi:putative membrane protein [Novosphingobium fluoreni]|uniref:Putative membrane protein n=1 Tax=Novosphingobium fluoreni TaxID=1391222 RepID=A0A7W6BZJ2_9SPHN|nr:putative membrane protein [Novosphingobium fluoreni]